MYTVAQKRIHYLLAVTFPKIQMPVLNIGELAVLERISKHFMSSFLINVLGQTQRADLHLLSSTSKLHCCKDVMGYWYRSFVWGSDRTVLRLGNCSVFTVWVSKLQCRRCVDLAKEVAEKPEWSKMVPKADQDNLKGIKKKVEET